MPKQNKAQKEISLQKRKDTTIRYIGQDLKRMDLEKLKFLLNLTGIIISWEMETRNAEKSTRETDTKLATAQAEIRNSQKITKETEAKLTTALMENRMMKQKLMNIQTAVLHRQQQKIDTLSGTTGTPHKGQPVKPTAAIRRFTPPEMSLEMMMDIMDPKIQ